MNYDKYIVFAYRFSEGDVKALSPFSSRRKAEMYIRRVNRMQGGSYFCWLRGYQDPPKIKGVKADEMNELTRRAMSEFRKSVTRCETYQCSVRYLPWRPWTTDRSLSEETYNERYQAEEEYLKRIKKLN